MMSSSKENSPLDGWPVSRVFLVLLVSIQGCLPDLEGAVGGGPGNRDAGDTPPPTEVTLATYNVENFDFGGTGEEQYAAVARFAATEAVDVLVLEEIQNDAAGDDEAAFTRALDDASYPMAYHSLSSMSDGFNAIGVWSRFPLSDVREILRENTRTVLRFGVQIDDDRLWCYGCHLKSGGDSLSRSRRREESARLEAYIAKNHDPASEHIAVLGDMNTMSDDDWRDGGTMSCLALRSDNPGNTANDLTAVNYRELPEGWTYPARSSLLDHLLLSPAALERYQTGSVRIPEPVNDTGRAPSDHLPVVLDLRY
jgi:endonuclease/exonuclease/phosphatase family metal-dependent hydrolase